jgi:hypothetical protein
MSLLLDAIKDSQVGYIVVPSIVALVMGMICLRPPK